MTVSLNSTLQSKDWFLGYLTVLFQWQSFLGLFVMIIEKDEVENRREEDVWYLKVMYQTLPGASE